MSDPAVSVEEKPKVFLCEKPTENGRLEIGGYYFQLLEPEILSQVTVPFAEIDQLVSDENNNNNSKGQNDDDDDEGDEETAKTKREQKAKQDAQSLKVAGLTNPIPNTKLNKVLDEWGFAVIPDILSSTLELETMRSLFAQDLLSIISKVHTDPETLAEIAKDPINHFPLDQVSLGHMFVSDFGLPHGRLAWHTRTHAKIKKAFATIYGENPDGSTLCTSTDNLFFSNIPVEFPWEVEKSEDKEEFEAQCVAHQLERLWPHCDQNMQDPNQGLWRIFQSALYVNPVDERTGATVVWPKSHREVTEKMFYEKKMFFPGHYCPLPREYQAGFIRNARRIPVPAGGLLIWNSRTTHQGFRGQRLAVPICLEPKARRPEDRIETKKKLIRKGAPSTHWSSYYVAHDLGYNDRPRDSKDEKLMVIHRAHEFLFGGDISKEKLPAEIESML